MSEEKVNNAINRLRSAVNESMFIDVSEGTEDILRCTKEELNLAINALIHEGYKLHRIKINHLFDTNKVTLKALCHKHSTLGEVMNNLKRVESLA